ncbi:MAG: TIR domain-containing protein [Pirellulaceae bacterium]
MKERFEGDGRQNLIEALKQQSLTAGKVDIANALADAGKLVEFAKGEKLTIEGAEDNEIYLIISGLVAIVVKGTEVARRHAGQSIGEMAAIEPSLKRAATVVALDTVVAVKIKSADFSRVGEDHGEIWRPIAQSLAKRLFQRNELIQAPNTYPRLFVISSAEALDVAREIQSALDHDVLCTVWTDGVFFAGGYPLEILEREVEKSDFAVAIAQPDDVVKTRGMSFPTLRDNVLFELGLFMGRLTRHRTILVHPRVDGLKLPSDLHGLTLASFASGEPHDLRARLGPACNEIRTLVRNLGVLTHNAKSAN